MNYPALSLPTTTSELVGQVLKSSGLKQAELARRAGIPRSVLNAYLRGKRQPGTDALTRICAAAGMELQLAPRSAPVDPMRASNLLTQVLELAEALPFRRIEQLNYPRLPATTA